MPVFIADDPLASLVLGTGRMLSDFADTGERVLTLTGGSDGTTSVHWSPDALFLASSSRDKSVRTWNVAAGSLVQACEGHSDEVRIVRWSPDGSRLASGSKDHTVRIWDSSSGATVAVLKGHREAICELAWHPSGRRLASSSFDGSVRLWDASSWEGREQTPVPEGYTSLSWAPNGAFLAVGQADGRVRFFDTRDINAQTIPVSRPRDHATPVPSALRPLPVILSQLHRLGLYPPLSLVRDLLDLLSSGESSSPLQTLASHPGMRALTMLRWPAPAHIGLIALLLHEVPSEGWTPPADLAPPDLRRSLTSALEDSEPSNTEPPPPFTAAIQVSASRIDDRLLTLLELLGAKAVTADPGLPLRLLGRLPRIQPLDPGRRRLLNIRLQTTAPGQSSGAGLGSERGGIDQRGDARLLLPSQWALPDTVRAYRHVRGELLYRARQGAEAPRLRPAVVVLDVSPATFGWVEQTTRLAAHAIGASLREAGVEVVVVTAGGEGTVRAVETAADLLEVWTARSMEAASAVKSVEQALRVRSRMDDGGREAVVIVLSHAWFGAEEEIGKVTGLRGLFVQYPGQHVTPTMAGQCEKWGFLTLHAQAALKHIFEQLVLRRGDDAVEILRAFPHQFIQLRQPRQTWRTARRRPALHVPGNLPSTRHAR